MSVKGDSFSKRTRGYDTGKEGGGSRHSFVKQ